MSHHYIRDHYGSHCYFRDNSWKRMQRYNASHGDTLIFNYNYGSSYGCCNTGWFGGGWFGGGCCAPRNFWSGLGAGIGHGLANALGGFLGGFMNMPFGWSSFGMPFLGSGFGTPIFNNYGMVPNYVNLFTPTLTPANTGSKPSSTTPSSTDNNSTSSTTGTDGASGNADGASGNTNGATGNTNGATGNTNGATGNTNGATGNTNGASGNTNSTVEELTARASQINDNSSYDDIDKLINDMQGKKGESGLSQEDIQELENKIEELEPKKAAALVKEHISGSKPLDLTNTQYLIENLDKLDEKSKANLKLQLENVDLSDLKNSAKKNNYFVSNKPEKMYQLYLLSELTGKAISLTVENFAKGDDPSITGTFESIEPNDNGYIDFVIDCKDTGKVGAKWTLSQISDTECKPIKAVREKAGGSGEELELNDVKYTWDSTQKCWCNKTNTSSIKDYQRVKKQE